MSLFSKTHADRPCVTIARIKACDAALRYTLDRRDERGREAQERLRVRRSHLQSAFIAGKGVEVHYESC